MSKNRSTAIRLAANDIQNMVRVVRGQRVMLDFDLARLYGVTTKHLNEQVARNLERFPETFRISLRSKRLRLQMSQNAISRSNWGGRRKQPWAFIEYDVVWLSVV